MSNSEASKVYEQIVESVVNEVREDFENAGIDEQTLQDLKRVWTKKITESQVAHFTWEPQMDEIIPPIDPNTSITDGTPVLAVPSDFTLKDDSQGLVLPGLMNENGTTSQATQSTETSGNVDKDKNTDTEKTENDKENSTEEDSANLKNESSQQIELTIEDPDGTVTQKLKQQAKQSKRSALLDTDEVGSELDDSDDDYLISEGEDDGPDENLVLCLYEKVTRTKARWKCSLKDGIATINRKDYTFQKAQVEAEWV
ncbi:hypothetical protein TBLA_0E04050 [Henningerozyma blattae CBS 6284]|uniref:Transcription initiation factor IIA large subunit n=1 Tax=Henningerozyma blattae (strain ATCC 34711 / CBS 6284 / DSM 70876 / NBRC 10599 / NRRL Y-10934 / UCD 77-7) TaxID=1071380 RepID=I2H508_HENB6|nr:hypothetical protein TBLA_0E04050 [Tetrapisispora blattae CBS 6284]CCH61460.1 hypothetical protein TBLA_0E04050 [Tetrapisispora blattae CBS 6284]